MATYKDIYYSDTSEKLLVANISYAEAVSIGDKLESIKADTAFAVANEAARTALYPSPTQGDAVWRNDLKIEQRYYGLYSATNPGGKSIAGWYASSSSYAAIVPTTVTSTTSGATVSINQSGEVNFSNAIDITLNNAFPVSGLNVNYFSYKILVDINTINPATPHVRWAFTSGGSVVSGTYHKMTSGYYNTAVITNTFTSGDPSLSYSAVNHTSCYAEIDISNGVFIPATSGPYKTYKSRSTNSASSTFNEVFNSVGHVKLTDQPDGIKFYASSGTELMSGTIKVYGIR
jgi:hypothetical protein